MKKLFLLLICLFIYQGISYSDEQQWVVITKGINYKIYDEAGQYVGVVTKNDAFPLYRTETNESTTVYWFMYKNSKISIEANKAGIIKPYDKSEKDSIYADYYGELNNVEDIDLLEKEFNKLLDEYNDRDLTYPVEYYLARFLAIKDKLAVIGIINKKGKVDKKAQEVFYVKVQKFIMKEMAMNDTDDKFHSDVLIKMTYHNLLDKQNLVLMKDAFYLNKTKESASGLLRQMSYNSLKEDEPLLRGLWSYLDGNCIEYYWAGLFYQNIKEFDDAIDFYVLAEEKAKNESGSFFDFDLVGKPRLAYLYANKKDYANAAIRYLYLESKYGGYAFQAAYCSSMAMEQGHAIPDVDSYKIIELYKRSNSAGGYYDAGLLYIQMGSQRNARLMAEILRNKFKEIEKANILLDDADKLDARLKGHNP